MTDEPPVEVPPEEPHKPERIEVPPQVPPTDDPGVPSGPMDEPVIG